MSLVYTAESGLTGGRRSHLYIGSRSDARDVIKLQERGVTHILNVTPKKAAGIQSGVPNFFEKDRCFVYHRVPVFDSPTSASDLLGYADSIVSFISKGLHHGAVLVHCNKGQSRSTTAALFFLISKAQMPLTKALEMIQRRRPTAEPIPSFLEILDSFEAKCAKEREKEGKSNSKGGTEKKRGPSMPKQNGGSGQEKRRKVGPSIGPSMGPSLGPSSASIGPQIAPSIGPSLPPSTEKEATSKVVIGPSRPPTLDRPTSIGPSLPSGASSAKKSIGPSLPPS